MADLSCLDSYVALTATCTRLRQTFGAAFEVWTEAGSRWEPVCGTMADELDADLVLWLDSKIDALRSGQSASLNLGDMRTLVAIPITDDGAPITIALGNVRVDPARLAAAAGNMLRSSLLSSAEVSDLNLTVDEYRRQVTADFEERTYLRQIVSYAEDCEVTRPLSDVADEILPELKSLTSVRALYLVAPLADETTEEAVPGRIVSGVATKPVPESEVLALIRRFANSKSTRPSVRAAARCPELRELCPSADTFAMTTLIRDGVISGWLVAIDRDLVPDAQEFETGGPSEFELGTVEASLLESTGILLTSHAQNRQHFAEKEHLTTELVRSLVAVLDARDEYTFGHSDRVAAMARQLAASVGLLPEECETVYLSGLLHDLGKVGVADDVLLKPGQLTDEEFAQIKEHPQRGYDLLKRLEPLKDMLPGVLHHHEAWDGSGYPHGLAGEEIPLIARLLAVADAFDAMTSNRPYRNGIPLEKAQQILTDGAGKTWDAELVERFIEQLPRMIELCQTSRQRTDRLLHRDGEFVRENHEPLVVGEIEKAISLRGASHHSRSAAADASSLQ